MLGLDPRECIVIENAPLGVTSGKNAGCLVITIQTTLPAKYLEKADFVVKTFQDVQEKLFSLLKLNEN